MKAIEVLKNIANSSIDFGYEKDATESIKEIESIKKENTRLKKQLSKGHHVECSCSFCKPVYENQTCSNCKHSYTEYKFDLLFDKCKIEKCNWEVKC